MKSKLPTSRAKTAYGLLSEVCALIIEEPLRYNQRDWVRRQSVGDRPTFEPGAAFPRCGTVGCVAGWVATLNRRSFRYEHTPAIATAVLGLTREQADRLFAGDAADGAPQTTTHATAGVKHIRKFQKKYRAQLLAKKVR